MDTQLIKEEPSLSQLSILTNNLSDDDSITRFA